MGMCWSAPPAERQSAFVPQFKTCRVVRVIDGDTVEVEARLGWCSSPTLFTLRLSGVDCPEKRSKNAGERRIARLATQYTTFHVLNKSVRCQVHCYGTYRGRLIASLWVPEDGRSLAQKLLRHRLAVPYDGKKKKSPADWRTYNETGRM